MMPSYSPTGARTGSYGGDARNPGADQNFSQFGYQGGFSFQRRHGKIDWKRLAAVDVDRIAREVDVQTLQDNIAHMAFCDVENELSVRDADFNLVKLFRLAQLLVEYLLHSQEYLQGYITQIECQMKNSIQDQANLRDEMEKKSTAYRNLKKEYQKSKKLIAEYQMMLRAGASGFHKCPFCSKSFLSDEFLKSHILRRHNEKAQGMSLEPQNNTNLMFVDGKSRLSPSFSNQDELLKELGNISSKLQETEARLVAEREERDRKFEASREVEMKRIEQFSRDQLRAKDEEIKKMKNDIESHKDMFLRELNDLHTEKNVLEKRFQDFQNQSERKPSMLGNLQDVTSDTQREEEISQVKEQLQQELMTSYQAQLEKVNKMAKRREEQVKKAHHEEMEKVTSLLSKYEQSMKQKEEEKEELRERLKKEEALYNDRFERYEKMFENQKMQMSNMEEMLNKRRSKVFQDDEILSGSRIEQTASPVASSSTFFSSTPVNRRSLEIPKDTQDSDETITLHVASNSKNIFRVWKSSAPITGEWKDTLVFRASAVQKGQFIQPIYVYCASGSPYWRQYVSRSSAPPRACYKLDFKFFVSNTQLMGTTRYFVLDAGSGEVVKSMISKSEIYPGWKPKGLSFFAFRGPQDTNLQKSVSFQSTLNESEYDSGDDVSVSSYTGTEDARKHLAAAISITRSKENILEEPKEKVKEIEREEEDEEDEDVEEENSFSVEPSQQEDDEDVTLDETDGKLDMTGGSTSQWGSTLMRTGNYLPYTNNPLAVARYNHSREMIDSCRQEAIDILRDTLEKRGIDPDATGMDEAQFATKMNMHENEIKVFFRKHQGEEANRERLIEELDTLARDQIGQRTFESPRTPTEKPSKSKFRSAVNKIKNAAKFARSPKKTSKPKLRDVERTSSFINKSFDDQTPIEGSLRNPSPTPRISPRLTPKQTPKLTPKQTPKLTPKATPREVVRPSPKQERKPDVQDEEEMFNDVSENSKWDSDSSSELSPTPTGTFQNPTITVTMPSKDKEEPVQMRQPRGAKVKELTESLELSLNLRGNIKKPAGAVDLHDNTDKNPAKPSVDSYDDDDYSISSMEDDYALPLPAARRNDESKDKYTFGAKQTPGSSTNVRADATAISKFTADSDFDSDSDLGL